MAINSFSTEVPVNTKDPVIHHGLGTKNIVNVVVYDATGRNAMVSWQVTGPDDITLNISGIIPEGWTVVVAG